MYVEQVPKHADIRNGLLLLVGIIIFNDTSTQKEDHKLKRAYRMLRNSSLQIGQGNEIRFVDAQLCIRLV